MKLRLAFAGLGGGDPEKVGRMRADWVMKAMKYMAFQNEYEDVFVEMNRGKE